MSEKNLEKLKGELKKLEGENDELKDRVAELKQENEQLREELTEKGGKPPLGDTDRDDVLELAGVAINRRRDEDGESIDDFHVQAEFWSTYLRHRFGVEIELEEWDICHMMDLFKTSRNVTSAFETGEPELENFVDGVGYLANGAERAGDD